MLFTKKTKFGHVSEFHSASFLRFSTRPQTCTLDFKFSSLTMAETQETSARIRILLPESAKTDIKFVETSHAPTETLSDLREALTATAILNNITNYSLVHKDVNITSEYDEFTTLGEILGTTESEFELRLTERAYTLKDVYEHLLRFREKIGMNLFDAAAHAHGYLEASCLPGLKLKDVKTEAVATEQAENVASTQESEVPKPDQEADKEPKKPSATPEDLAAIREVIESFTARSLPSRASSPLSKWTLPIKSLSISQWTVTPAQRAKGDLIYLTLTTLESETFSVTCHASGFFVSRLSNANFDPSVKVNEKGVAHRDYAFYNLVSQLSPTFSQTLDSNRAALAEYSQFPETYLIPTQIPKLYPWKVDAETVKAASIPDLSRAQLPILSSGVDGADVVKDWNDEFQGIKEFPRGTFNERLLRDKLIAKYIHDFSQTAVSTACDIVRGNVAPLNPQEPRDKHIFLRNNIFYSFGVNATGAHDLTGGDEAARYCFSKDIAAVRLLNRVDADSVCNLLSCVVDFLGERVVCQAPVPGIFADHVDAEGNPADKVAYGYLIESDTVHADKDFETILKPVAEAFHLKPHSVELASGSKAESPLLTSKDIKGIKGTDGRKYVIDLYRTTPLDIEFIERHFSDSEQSYPHREASIRHEAVEEWYKRKAAAIFKQETERLEKEGKLKDNEKVALPYDQIVLNPDAFTGVGESQDDQDEVRGVSKFIYDQLIPDFLADISKNSVPFDGSQLADYMHKSGINMRYLGILAKLAQKMRDSFLEDWETTATANLKLAAEKKEKEEKEEKEKKEKEKEETTKAEEEKTQDPELVSGLTEKADNEQAEAKETQAKLQPVVANMTALVSLCTQEMVARGAKHVLRRLSSGVQPILLPYLIAHFHNCLLGAAVNEVPHVAIDDTTKAIVSEKSLSFSKLTPADVRDQVSTEVYRRFRYKLPENWDSEVRKTSLLREIALKFGIQWKSQTFHFEKAAHTAAYAQPKSVTFDLPQEKRKGKKAHKAAVATQTPKEPRTTVFEVDDVLGFVPIVKDSGFRCSFVDEIFEAARTQVKSGEKEVGLALLAELVSFYQQIYGNVHLETTDFLSTLAATYAEYGMKSEASILARKAVIGYERLVGPDAYETINAYIKASFYDSLNGDHVSAFKLNTKAFSLWESVFGDNHPSSVNTLLNFGTILQELSLNDMALALFEKAIEMSESMNGPTSDITGIIRHRLGVMKVQNNDFEGALEQFTQAGDIFVRAVGPDDFLAVECVTFATNLKRFLAYNEEKKKQAAQATHAVKKTPSKPVKEQSPPAKKKGNGTAPNPDIANKSVDEIMRFIQGDSKPKKKRK